jgi:hypothetical protein
MANESSLKLFEFVTAAKNKGASDDFLASFLARRGWAQDDVYAALGKYWESVTGLVVPDRTATGESARDAFLYLLSFSTLATSATALGSMLFRLIEYWLPDPVAPLRFLSIRQMVTWQMASIAVAFPIFLFAMRTILREARLSPERLKSGVRKWLTYIALLITAGAMIGDLICFLDYFLQGELTSRFVLKCLTVLIIAGTIFAYYRRDTNVQHSRKFAIGSAVVLIAAFLAGLGVAGTPSIQRRLQADQRRVENLQDISRALYYQRVQLAGEPMPATLAGLVGKWQATDPETGKLYDYRVKSGTQYELCAVFDEPEEQNPYPSQFWRHGKGRTCFTLDAKANPTW